MVRIFVQNDWRTPFQVVPIKNGFRYVSVNAILESYFTQIKMLLPNGIEYWFIRDFESGPGRSKWFRGVSVLPYPKGAKIPILNIIGLTNSAISAYYYEHSLKQNQEKIPWLKLAETLVFECDRTDYNKTLDCKESKTDTAFEAIATFEVITYSDGNKKRYIGKSTRPVKKTRRPKNEKETMEKEAKKAALMEYIKERFGVTNFDDIHRDELHRPIKM